MACGCCQGRCRANLAHLSVKARFWPCPDPLSGKQKPSLKVFSSRSVGVRGCGDLVGPAARSGTSVRQSFVPPSLAQPSPPKWSRLIGRISHNRDTNREFETVCVYQGGIPSRNYWCNPANLKQSYHARVTCAILKSRSAEIRPSLRARLALLTGEIARDFPQFRTCLPGNIS